MGNTLGMFQRKGHPTEEGIQAIAALAGCIQDRFSSYLTALGPSLEYSLAHTEAVSLCKAGTMLIGDIARALKDSAGHYIDDLVTFLLQNLVKADISGEIKLQSIESLADIASNTKSFFNKYAAQTLNLIDSASTMSLQEVDKMNDPDLAEYLRNLREAIAQFYENFVQGQLTGGNQEELLNHVPGIIRYILQVSADRHRPSATVHITCIGLIGDLANAYRQRVRELLKVAQVTAYLQLYRTSNNTKLREVANWSFNLLSSV